MSAALVAPNPFVPDTGAAIAELRREAVSAVVRQHRVQEEIAEIRTRAHQIEKQASRAAARGEELLARQILSRGMFTLKTRDILEAELAEARGEVRRLLTTMVRAEKQAWLARRY